MGDDAEQQRMFLEEPGDVSPPEPGLYLGTSGWSYADWEGSVYTPKLAAGARLSEYVNHDDFAAVEIDSTFYGTPRRQTVSKWREVAPKGFRFAAKFPQEITHEKQLSGCKPLADAFVETMSELGDKLGPLLVQLPPYFEAGSLKTLETFLDDLPKGPRYAVEVRHRSWVDSDLAASLRERNVALTLVDYPSMPRQEISTTDFIYVRWLGDRREFPANHTAARRDRSDDLAWWANFAKDFLGDGPDGGENREVYAFANNHYQNHSPTTVRQFLEIYREGKNRG